MKEEKEDIINRIKATLSTHEMPYREGAWENFAAAKAPKSKSFLLWYSGVAAAALLLAFYFLLNPQARKEPVITQAKPVETPLTQALESPQAGPVKLSSPTVKNKLSTAFAVQAPKHNYTLNENKLNTEVTYLERINNPNLSITLKENPIARIQNPKSKAAINRAQKLENFLAQQRKPELLSSKKTEEDKWGAGLYVAPALGQDDKVTLNYGLSLSYNLDPKLALVSGLSYTNVAHSNQYMANLQYSDAKQLDEVKANLKGINIPLELKYQFNERFYAGAGISATAIIDYTQKNEYVTTRLESSAVFNPNGITETKVMVTPNKTTEEVPMDEAIKQNFIGYYNFSLGVNQKISSKNKLSVEPYMRIPMQSISKESMKMTDAGLRIKFNF